MIEKQRINNKEVWIKIEAINMHRDNPDTIPTEYFSASYYLTKPIGESEDGELIKDEEGNLKRFESPVAALSYAEKVLEKIT